MAVIRTATLLATLLLMSLSTVAAADASSLELQTVLASTTVTPPARVGFHEQRHNPLLEVPLVLTGYLEYLEAGVLRKAIETPFQEALLVNTDHIVIERQGETRKLSLNKSRSLKTILGAIEAILAGEADKLAAVFDYELSGTAGSWSVKLTPISRRIARQLTSLQVYGDDESVTSIRVDLKDGEWHQMDILRDDPEQ
jgi:hypothetical protein